MPNGREADLGVIKFMPLESFENPSHGLSRPEQRERDRERLLALLRADAPSEPLPIQLGDWPRVSHAVCRNGLFVIEGFTPFFTVMLRFCPERPDAGDYEILGSTGESSEGLRTRSRPCHVTNRTNLPRCWRGFQFDTSCSQRPTTGLAHGKRGLSV